MPSAPKDARVTRPSADAHPRADPHRGARPVRRPVVRGRHHAGDRRPGRRLAAVAQLPLPDQGRAVAGRGRPACSPSSTRRMQARIEGLRGVDDLTTAKLVIRDFITFSAAHPQLHRIITQESKGEGQRIDWLVDEHVRPLYEMTTGLVRAPGRTGCGARHPRRRTSTTSSPARDPRSSSSRPSAGAWPASIRSAPMRSRPTPTPSSASCSVNHLADGAGAVVSGGPSRTRAPG